jgi:hypothetical protein
LLNPQALLFAAPSHGKLRDEGNRRPPPADEFNMNFASAQQQRAKHRVPSTEVNHRIPQNPKSYGYSSY